MPDTELCQSLLYAIAGSPTAVPWAAVAIHPAGCLLLWDDREDTTSLILEAIPSECGDVLATANRHAATGPNTSTFPSTTERLAWVNNAAAEDRRTASSSHR